MRKSIIFMLVRHSIIIFESEVNDNGFLRYFCYFIILTLNFIKKVCV